MAKVDTLVEDFLAQKMIAVGLENRST